MRSRYLVSIFILLAAALAGHPPATPAASASHQTAPDFELPDLTGAMHKLSDYRGKVVLLNFWASWCRECVAEIPSLNAVSAGLKQEGLIVIGVSIDRNPDEVAGMGIVIDYPVLLDKKGDVFVKKFTITRIPVTLVINRDGLIVEKVFGRRDFSSEAYVGKIRKLLQEKASR